MRVRISRNVYRELDHIEDKAEQDRDRIDLTEQHDGTMERVDDGERSW